jgi:hypothetical protein
MSTLAGIRSLSAPVAVTLINLRGVAQSGSAPALGANFWRRWASVSAINAGFCVGQRWWASVSNDAVFGTVSVADRERAFPAAPG